MPQTQQDGAADEEAEEKQCIICFDAPRSIRFRPCHHSTMCDGCVLKLIAHSENRKLNCPSCCQPIVHLCCEGAGAAEDQRGLLARALALELATRRAKTVLLLDFQTNGAAHLRALGGEPEPVDRVEGHVLAFPTAHERLWVAYDSQHTHLTDARAGEAEASRMLGLLKREFDVILVVAADASDYAARRLAGLMDANLLVVRGEVTKLRAARERRDEILAAGGALPGIAFTGRREVLPPVLAALVPG
jgi:hypothetical protein